MNFFNVSMCDLFIPEYFTNTKVMVDLLDNIGVVETDKNLSFIWLMASPLSLIMS